MEIEEPQQMHDIEVNMPIVEDEAPLKEQTNELAVEETIQYINEIAKEMKIDDLVITEKRDGKFIHLHLK